jgi:hypothetical protein
MGSTGVKDASTAEATRSCFEQFVLCFSKLSGVQNIHIKNRQADFKLWATALGLLCTDKRHSTQDSVADQMTFF